MAQRRMLSRRISLSKKVNRLTLKAQLVYTWTIPYLDDYGCYTADPEDVKHEVFPKNKRISINAIECALAEEKDGELIKIYEANGKLYQKYNKFDSFQTFQADRPKKHIVPPLKEGLEINGTQCNPVGSLSKEKLSKEKLSQTNTTVVFDRWNFYKGRKKWKSHNSLSYEIEQAITEQLKHYSVEDLCGAIDNYANILLSPDFKWSYAWTLQQFLTRCRPDNRQEKQLWRFLPNNYHDDDYLTDSARRTRAEQRKVLYDHIMDYDEETLIEAYKANKKGLNWLIDELRPEIKGKAKQKDK